MKISIITPSYNQGKYIEDAIHSVLQQNYPDFEHIIVDGASTDDTVERLKKYPHLIWVSEKDKGQSNALNKGFRMATGDIICWLNCDDFYLPGTFHRVVNEIKESGSDGVYSDLSFCDENKKIVNNFRSNRPDKYLSLFQTYICSETLFIKRRIIDNNEKIDENLHYCMDQEFAARLLFRDYKLKYVNACFATFRWQGQNKSIQSPETLKKTLTEGLTVFNRYNSLIKLNPEKEINLKMYNIFRTFMRFYRLILKFTS
jgi:glycosyltransferase involved in cell wall biosynthesis